MMAKHRYSDTEARLALETLFKHLDLDNVRDARLAHCILLSIGRVYLRYWTGEDASDRVSYDLPGGRHMVADGYDMIQHRVLPTLKWRQRATIYEIAFGDHVRHVVDWLTVAVENNAPWLTNTDAKNRPKKLMKCGSIEALAAEADKAMMKALQASGVRAPLPDTDERVIITLGELSLVRLLTPSALDVESTAMRHCIGLGSYDDLLSLPGLEYYSVRDTDNRPLATLEIGDGVILQMSGPRKSHCVSAAYDFIIAIRDDLGWISRGERMSYSQTPSQLSAEDVERIGFVVERSLLTAEERQRVIEERALRLREPGYQVDDLHLDDVFGRTGGRRP